MDKEKVVLAEISGIHYEVVYSHIKCLKESGYEVIFVCYDDVESRPEVYEAADKEVLISEPISRWIKPFQLLRILQLLVKERCRNLVIATADSGVLIVRIFLLILSFIPVPLNIVRCIHNFKPLKEKKIEKKYFSRLFEKVVVLNDYIIKANEKVIKEQNICVESFNPIFFPKSYSRVKNKKDENTWICIPGKINKDRRDYYELIRQIDKKNLDKRLRFLLLGGDDGDLKDLRNEIEKKGLLNRFFMFNSVFIDQKILNSYIKKSDFIMPLIHPNKGKYKKYIDYKVSGAFNLAFGFKKPLVCARDYEGYKDFDHLSVFYSVENICSVLNKLPYLGQEVIDEEYYSKKMNTEYQSEKYKEILIN